MIIVTIGCPTRQLFSPRDRHQRQADPSEQPHREVVLSWLGSSPLPRSVGLGRLSGDNRLPIAAVSHRPKPREAPPPSPFRFALPLRRGLQLWTITVRYSYCFVGRPYIWIFSGNFRCLYPLRVRFEGGGLAASRSRTPHREPENLAAEDRDVRAVTCDGATRCSSRHLRPAEDCQAAQIKSALGGSRAIADARDRQRPRPSGPYSATRQERSDGPR